MILKIRITFNQIMGPYGSNRRSATISIINSHLWFQRNIRRKIWRKSYSIIKETIDERKRFLLVLLFTID